MNRFKRSKEACTCITHSEINVAVLGASRDRSACREVTVASSHHKIEKGGGEGGLGRTRAGHVTPGLHLRVAKPSADPRTLQLF